MKLITISELRLACQAKVDLSSWCEEVVMPQDKDIEDLTIEEFLSVALVKLYRDTRRVGEVGTFWVLRGQQLRVLIGVPSGPRGIRVTEFISVD